MKGKFVVVDGLDGVGKGVFLDEFISEAIKQGKRVFDANKYWQEKNEYPDVSEIIGNYGVVVTSEPTFVGLGKYIRDELIKNGKHYSPEAVAEAYALDRRILYEQLVLPVLNAGIDVYQSRSFSTSIVYQKLMALEEGRDFSMEDILKIPGNAFCYQHPFDFLVMPTIMDVGEVIRRVEARDKDDDCQFENLDFQLKAKQIYDGEEFRNIFTRVGTDIKEMDAGKTLEHSKEQAREFYRTLLS